jgi:hypothetical protein
MSREFDELLSAYLDGEVSPEERAAVEHRLEQSPELRETLDELSEVGDLIRRLPTPRAPVDLPQRVVAAISPKPLVTPPVPRKRNRLFGVWPLLAAGTALAAGVAIVVLLPREQKDLADGLALNSPRPGGAATSLASEMSNRGLVESDGAIRTASGDESRGANWNDFSTEATKALTEDLVKLGRQPVPGGVRRTLVDKAGQTYLVQFTVVDTRRMGDTVKTIFANNNLNVVETETPALQTRPTAEPEGANRLVYVIKGSPQQLEHTLEEIESVSLDLKDLAVLDPTPDPPPSEFFVTGEEAKTRDDVGLMFAKDKADRMAAPAAAAAKFGIPAPPAPDSAAPVRAAVTPPAPASASAGATGVANPARSKNSLEDQIESKPAQEAVKVLNTAPAEAPVARGELDKLSASPPATQSTNGYIGVSTQLDSKSPLVENVLRARAAGNSIQGNSIQGNSVQWNFTQTNSFQENSTQGNSFQRSPAKRESVGQTQNPANHYRYLQRPEDQLGRKVSEPAAGEPQEKLSEKETSQKRQTFLRQQLGTSGRANAENDRDADAAGINTQNVPSREEELVQVLLILEPQAPQPAAPVTPQALPPDAK